MRWTPEETALLADMMSRGASWAEMARATGRTVGSVRNKVFAMRGGAGSGRKAPATWDARERAEQEARGVQLLSAGLDPAVVAERVGSMGPRVRPDTVRKWGKRCGITR